MLDMVLMEREEKIMFWGNKEPNLCIICLTWSCIVTTTLGKRIKGGKQRRHPSQQFPNSNIFPFHSSTFTNTRRNKCPSKHEYIETWKRPLIEPEKRKREHATNQRITRSHVIHYKNLKVSWTMLSQKSCQLGETWNPLKRTFLAPKADPKSYTRIIQLPRASHSPGCPWYSFCWIILR